MFSRLLGVIFKDKNLTLAVMTNLVVIASAFISPQWWGEKSLGVIYGAAVYVIFITLASLLLKKLTWDPKRFMPWIQVLVPTALALVLHQNTRNYQISFPRISWSDIPPPQSILLLLVAVSFLALLLGLIRSLSNGETVSVESHWGGLGGGVAGWRVSGPLVYLAVLILLAAVSSALAWRVFPPNANQVQSAPSGPAEASPSPTPAVSSTP